MKVQMQPRSKDCLRLNEINRSIPIHLPNNVQSKYFCSLKNDAFNLFI